MLLSASLAFAAAFFIYTFAKQTNSKENNNKLWYRGTERQKSSQSDLEDLSLKAWSSFSSNSLDLLKPLSAAAFFCSQNLKITAKTSLSSINGWLTKIQSQICLLSCFSSSPLSSSIRDELRLLLYIAMAGNKVVRKSSTVILLLGAAVPASQAKISFQ